MSWSKTSRVALSNGRTGFLKSEATSADVFPAERLGLELLAATGKVNVPEVISGDEHHILLRFIENRNPTDTSMRTLGRQLAQLHRLPQDTCGLATDNYLGGSRQLNTTLRGGPKAWPRFFLENRLNFQASMAARSGLLGLSFMKRLSAATPRIEAKLATGEPLSLLHGDLWSGNVLTDQDQSPWLIDPAVYIGHREADLAMTSLFGGFLAGFRCAYEEEYPLTDGWRSREPIYQLYHVLNHLNLFGRGYLAQAETLLNAI